MRLFISHIGAHISMKSVKFSLIPKPFQWTWQFVSEFVHEKWQNDMFEFVTREPLLSHSVQPTFLNQKFVFNVVVIICCIHFFFVQLVIHLRLIESPLIISSLSDETIHPNMNCIPYTFRECVQCFSYILKKNIHKKWNMNKGKTMKWNAVHHIRPLKVPTHQRKTTFTSIQKVNQKNVMKTCRIYNWKKNRQNWTVLVKPFLIVSTG